MDKLKEIFDAIKADPQNINYTKEGLNHFILFIKKPKFVS